MWPKSRLLPVTRLRFHKQLEKPKKLIKREYDEPISVEARLRKFYTEIKCRRCGQYEHNDKTCYFALKSNKKL